MLAPLRTTLTRQTQYLTHRTPIHIRSKYSLPRMPRSFILCGISWDQFDVMFPDQAKRDEMIAVVKRGLDQTAQTFDEAGLEYEFFNCSPDEDMSRWEAKITEKKWDGIAV